MPVKRRVRALIVGMVLASTVALTSLEYTVQRGDTLSGIARGQGVSLLELIEANGIANPNLIYPGQVLVIPGREGQPDKVHVVSRGETLIRIASSYGSTAPTLARFNGLVNPNLIFPGQRLLIPGASGSSGGAPPSSGGATPSSGDGESEGSADPTPSSARSGRFHVVRRGETLETIAAQYQGLSAAEIARANGITNNRIYSGTRLFLDGPSFVGDGGGSGSGSYVVKQGDRLVDIANRYDTTVARLAELNAIGDVNLIRAGQTLTVPGSASWVCPVEGASFFNDWGFPRGTSRYHEGNDLFAPYGTPVRAPVAGTVQFKTGSLAGLQFNLSGVDGVEYLGSHLDRAGKSGSVQAGEVIGYMGMSGNAQGSRPQLHFGMYLDGVAVNPYPTLVANGC